MDDQQTNTPAEPMNVPENPVSDVAADATAPVSPPAPEPVTTPEPAQPAAQPDSAPVPQPAPTPQSEPAATPAPNSQPVATANHPPRLLLVEDDDALANVYVTRLQTEGFDVRRVANGEEALSAALNYKPDLIILDVMMPKVSGFDVLDILRNTPETANVKIVMLTALSQESDKERAQSLGVDDYLVKSQVVIADVIDRIKHHLGLQ